MQHFNQGRYQKAGLSELVAMPNVSEPSTILSPHRDTKTPKYAQVCKHNPLANYPSPNAKFTLLCYIPLSHPLTQTLLVGNLSCVHRLALALANFSGECAKLPLPPLPVMLGSNCVVVARRFSALRGLLSRIMRSASSRCSSAAISRPLRGDAYEPFMSPRLVAFFSGEFMCV